MPSSCKVPPYGPITGLVGSGGKLVDREVSQKRSSCMVCHSVCGEINVSLRQFGIIERKTFQYPQSVQLVGASSHCRVNGLIRSRVTSDRLSMNTRNSFGRSNTPLGVSRNVGREVEVVHRNVVTLQDLGLRIDLSQNDKFRTPPIGLFSPPDSPEMALSLIFSMDPRLCGRDHGRICRIPRYCRRREFLPHHVIGF